MYGKGSFLLKSGVFLLIGAILFFTVQALFVPDSSKGRSNADRVIRGFQTAEEDSVDVLFLGASHMGCGVSPLQFYKDMGICSYNLSTDGQPVDASFYLLEDFFRRQSPKVVIFDVSVLFTGDTSETSLRWMHILDNYPLGPEKFRMAKAYAEHPYSDGAFAALFPIVKYHDRWNDLLPEDFSSLLTKVPGSWLLGGRMETAVVANSYATTRLINEVADAQQDNTRQITVTNGETVTDYIDEPLFVPEISQANRDWLQRMKELCEAHGTQLVLTKIPVMQFTQIYASAWTRQKSNMLRDLATELEIPFFDLMYDYNTGLNWLTDTCDAGFHLNIRGQVKATRALEAYLTENFSIAPRPSAEYDRAAAAYDKAYETAMLQTETDFYAYLERLYENKDQWAILIAARDEFTLGMDEESYSLLEGMGLTLVRKAGFRESYAAILDRGRVRYESVSGRRIDYTLTVDGVLFSVGSAGWNVGAYSALVVNGTDYAQPVRGIGFLVYDNETGLVIDSVSFDPVLPGKPASRVIATEVSLFSEYQDLIAPEL